MRRRIERWLIVLGLLLGGHSFLAAFEIRIGDTIKLTASIPEGVPLHTRSENSFRGERVPDKTRATVVDMAHEGDWLRILLADGRERWVFKRYVGRVVPEDATVSGGNMEARVWDSPEVCQEVVRAGGRMMRRVAGDLRVASWNIRWFPDGEMIPDQDPATVPAGHRVADVRARVDRCGHSSFTRDS